MKKQSGKGKRTVKDLPARDGQDVKGGAGELSSNVLKAKHDANAAVIQKI